MDDRPWIVAFRIGGRRAVYRFATKAEASSKARRLRREGYSPVMVFRASAGR